MKIIKRLSSYRIIISLTILILVSCKKDLGFFEFGFRPLYGKWKLDAISGGFGGSGYKLNFDYLIIEMKDNYCIVKDGAILESGRIKIIEQSSKELKIEFILNKGKVPYMIFPSAYVEFYGFDTLSLNGSCCDWYNYHFVRK